MTRFHLLATACVFTTGTLTSSRSDAQARVTGSVAISDATATGVLEVSGGRSVLGGASTITTASHSAHVALVRGGDMEVCQGTVAHLAGSQNGSQNGSQLGNQAASQPDPLVFALDHGAMELRMILTSGDAILTPDLRLTAADRKPRALDLALRVTSNGDTCVDNRSHRASALTIAGSFDTGTYLLKPGQRALFEHGSLHEVVDREQGPCGCPTLPGTSLAGGPMPPGTQSAGTTGFPFPEAVSEGLAQPTPPPPEAPGVTHTQVSSTLDANPDSEPPPSVQAPVPPPAPVPTQNPGFLTSIGLFFKHLFAR